MREYLSHYGFHFSKNAFDLAVSKMKKRNPTTGKMMKIEPLSKEKVNEILEKNGVKLENDYLYDAAYTMNMLKTDMYGSSLEDERHLALAVKDYIDDPDGSEEFPFRIWLQKMVAVGCPVDWEEMM